MKTNKSTFLPYRLPILCLMLLLADTSRQLLADQTTSNANPQDSQNEEKKDGSASKDPKADDILLSFQGANIDVISQWLAQTTGKSVIKHPEVNCQLTITSSKAIPKREAIDLVYRALGLEKVVVFETNDSIIIVPEGKEPNLTPELLDNSQSTIPEGRQKLVKVFVLKHIQATNLKVRLKSALSKDATIEVDDKNNQLIITDYNDNLRTVSGLIEKLDMVKPEDISVRAITLKTLSATDVAKELAPLYEKRSGKSDKDSSEDVEVTADEGANSLLILSNETDFLDVQRLVTEMDTQDSGDKELHTFTLENADAEDVAQQLEQLNEGQQASARVIFNYNEASHRSSNLKVVPDRRRNAVIVQAPHAEIANVTKIIKQLDEKVNDDSLEPRIYSLKYANATDIEDVLNELFLKKKDPSFADFFFSDEAPQATPDRDVGRLYGKVRITSDAHSNSLIVTANSQENLSAVENIITKLDTDSEAGESTLHVQLQYAKADKTADTINILFARNGSPPLHPNNQNNQQNNPPANQNTPSNTSSGDQTEYELSQVAKQDGYFPWLGGTPDNDRSNSGRSATVTVSDLVGRVRAVADERSNSVMISANMHYFPQIIKLINDLDAPTAQVLIQARLMEVSSDFLDQLGVQWSPNGSQIFTNNDYDNSLLVHGSGTSTKGFNGTTTANLPSTATAVAGTSPLTLLTEMRSGVIQSTIGLDFLVQFLQKNTDAKVLGEPQVNVRDNETGRLFVGQEVPIPENTQVSTVGSQNTTFIYKNVGVTLEVTPHINTNGDVELQVHVESSTTVPGQTVLGGSVFNTNKVRTDLTAKNGQILVLGGILQKQETTTIRKFPILGDIPLLKYLFSKTDKEVENVELMIFLQPRVLRNPEDAVTITNEIDAKTPLLKKWEAVMEKKREAEEKQKSK